MRIAAILLLCLAPSVAMAQVRDSKSEEVDKATLQKQQQADRPRVQVRRPDAAAADEEKARPVTAVKLAGPASTDQTATPITAVKHGPPEAANRTWVACPVERLHTEVQTPLPQEWWHTPQVGELLDTAVARIGGEETLVCRYRAFGQSVPVMRNLPAGASACAARTGGFECW